VGDRSFDDLALLRGSRADGVEQGRVRRDERAALGGEQRIGPVTAVRDPPVALVHGLDPVARRAVWDHLSRLRSEVGMTLFLTTHYMEEADDLATRIAIMSSGRIAALGTADDLKAQVPGGAATLDEVFAHFTGDSLETGGSYRETRAVRRAARRLG